MQNLQKIFANQEARHICKAVAVLVACNAPRDMYYVTHIYLLFSKIPSTWIIIPQSLKSLSPPNYFWIQYDSFNKSQNTALITQNLITVHWLAFIISSFQNIFTSLLQTCTVKPGYYHQYYCCLRFGHFSAIWIVPVARLWKIWLHS